MTDESYMGPRDVSRRNHAVAGASDEATIEVSDDVLVVIERFEVPLDHQDNAVTATIAHIDAAWSRDKEFIAAVVLRGRDEGILAIHSQWYASKGAGGSAAHGVARSLEAALAGYKRVDGRTYSVAFTRQTPLQLDRSPVSVADTPLAHFGVFKVAPSDQDELLNRAAQNASNSLKVPGILAINFHRSHDGTQVINLGLWNGFEKFAALLEQPGFADKDEYFRGLAEFKPEYFDVVAVRAASAVK